jgi:hypothetical protein
MPPQKLTPLLQQFDAFTNQCEASKLPNEMLPSCILLGYDPLHSQGTFRMTGDPHALAQVMLVALRDPKQPAFREALEEVLDTILKE